MPEDQVGNEETLYRRVPNHIGNFKFENGEYRVSSAAFGDREKKQPSVDRAKLRDNDPKKSQESPTDCIAGLFTEEVRNKIDVPRIVDGRQARCYVDVLPNPIIDHPTLPDNPAHALICAIPDFSSKEETIFRKLKKALARLAKWEIPPA